MMTELVIDGTARPARAVDLGGVAIDSPKMEELNIRNDTPGDVGITMRTSARPGSFLFDETTICAGAEATLTLFATPESEGPQQAEILGNGEVLCRVVYTGAAVLLEPPSLDFGDVPCGEKRLLPVVITNSSGARIPLAPVGAFSFSQSALESSCEPEIVMVHFLPQTAGQYSEDIAILDGRAVLSLTGRGVS